MRAKRSTYPITRRFIVTATLPGTAPQTAANHGKIYVADRICTVVGFSESHEVVSTDVGAGVILERLQGVEVSGAGDAMTVETLYTAVANTPLFPALVGGAALTLAIGDRLNLIDNIAGVTALVGVCVTVELEEA